MYLKLESFKLNIIQFILLVIYIINLIQFQEVINLILNNLINLINWIYI